MSQREEQESWAPGLNSRNSEQNQRRSDGATRYLEDQDTGGLTPDGSAYCGLKPGSANGAWWPRQLLNKQTVAAVEPSNSLEGRQIDERRLSLAQTIEAEIIPRLLLLHQAAAPSAGALDAVVVGEPDEILQFGSLVTSRPLAEALEYVAKLQNESVPLETIYMALFAPTARHLGEMWEADSCSFADVTIGLSRLQQLMQSLSTSFCGPDVVDRAPRVLMLPSPGEQHTLGLYMVSEFFRREGWDVWGNSFHAGVDPATLVSAEWFDVIGFSVASEVKSDALKPCIDAVRRASQNPAIKVLLGGPLVIARPQLVEEAGADAMALDAPHAVKVATDLVSPEKWR